MTAQCIVEVQTEVLSLELFQTPSGFLCRRCRLGRPAESAECASVFDVHEFFGRGPTACELYRNWLAMPTTNAQPTNQESNS